MQGKTMRLYLIVAMAFVLVAIAGIAAAEDIDREFHQEFEVRPGMQLALDHGDGDVMVTPWEKDVLDVEVKYRAKASNIGWTKSTDFDVEFRQDGKNPPEASVNRPPVTANASADTGRRSRTHATVAIPPTQPSVPPAAGSLTRS